MGLEDMTKYAYGAVAGGFAKDNHVMAQSAIELLMDKNLDLDDATKEFLKDITSSEEGIKKAAQIYSNAYNKAKEEISIGDLTQHYDGILKGYLEGEDFERVQGELEKFSGETYGDVAKKLERAKYILDGKDAYEFSDDEKGGAKKTMEQYGTAFQILQYLENAELEGHRTEVRKSANKKIFSKISESLKDDSEENGSG